MAVGFVAAGPSATSKTSGTTLDILNCTTAAGNFVVVAFAMDPATGTVTVTDDAGNTYANDMDVANGTGTAGVRLVIASSTHATGLNGAQKIRITHPTAAARAAMMGRFSGVLSTSPKDASSSGTGSASPWTSGASGTPVQADELVIGGIGIERLSSDFTTIGTGMTPDQANVATPVGTSGGSATTNISVALMYALQTAATAQTADYTSTTSGVNYAAAVVTYKGSSGAVTSKSGSDTGAGTDASSALSTAITGTGETGTGTDASSEAAALTGTGETGTGTDASSGIGIAVADSGAGTDASAPPVVALTGTAESGAGTDASSPPAVDVSGAETGAGTDAALPSAAISGTGETGAGTDASAGIDLVSSDSGSGSDASASTAALSGSETGAGDDAAILIETSSSGDTGTGTDAGSVAVPVSAADSGSGVDAASGIALSGIVDSGSGTDAATLGAAFTVADTASGTEGTPTIGLFAADTAGATESASVQTSGEDQALSASDSGSLVLEQASLVVEVSGFDTASGTDASSLDTSGDVVEISGSDSGLSWDASAVSVSYTGTESAIGTDTADFPVVAYFGADFGLGDESATMTASLTAEDFGTAAEYGVHTAPGVIVTTARTRSRTRASGGRARFPRAIADNTSATRAESGSAPTTRGIG